MEGALFGTRYGDFFLAARRSRDEESSRVVEIVFLADHLLGSGVANGRGMRNEQFFPTISCPGELEVGENFRLRFLPTFRIVSVARTLNTSAGAIYCNFSISLDSESPFIDFRSADRTWNILQLICCMFRACFDNVDVCFE